MAEKTASAINPVPAIAPTIDTLPSETAYSTTNTEAEVKAVAAIQTNHPLTLFFFGFQDRLFGKPTRCSAENIRQKQSTWKIGHPSQRPTLQIINSTCQLRRPLSRSQIDLAADGR